MHPLAHSAGRGRHQGCEQKGAVLAGLPALPRVSGTAAPLQYDLQRYSDLFPFRVKRQNQHFFVPPNLCVHFAHGDNVHGAHTDECPSRSDHTRNHEDLTGNSFVDVSTLVHPKKKKAQQQHRFRAASVSREPEVFHAVNVDAALDVALRFVNEVAPRNAPLAKYQPPTAKRRVLKSTRARQFSPPHRHRH